MGDKVSAMASLWQHQPRGRMGDLVPWASRNNQSSSDSVSHPNYDVDPTNQTPDLLCSLLPLQHIVGAQKILVG